MGALTMGALQRAGALFPAVSMEPVEPENMASPVPAPAPPVGGALPNGALIGATWLHLIGLKN